MPFDFEKLEVYKKTINFANDVYNMTKKFPKDEQFGITSQVRRAAISVSLNIAEGNGRSKRGFKHYILLARMSVQECIPILKISFLQGCIDNEEVSNYYKRCEELSKMLCGLFNSLRTTNYELI